MTRKNSQMPSVFLQLSGLARGPGRLGRWWRRQSKVLILRLHWQSSKMKKIKKICSGTVPVFVHLYLYRTLKLTFPWSIGGHAIYCQSRTEMGQESMGEALGILSPAYLMQVSNPRKSGNVNLFRLSECPAGEVGVSKGETRSRDSASRRGYMCCTRDSFSFWRP